MDRIIDQIKNVNIFSIVIGVIFGLATYYVLKFYILKNNEEDDKENKNGMYSILAGVIFGLLSFYLFNMYGDSVLNNNSKILSEDFYGN